MQVGFEHPSCVQQHEYPEIIAAETASKRLPQADRKFRCEQRFRQVFRPVGVRGKRRHEHGGKEIRLYQAGAETPKFIISITASFDPKEDQH